jgi:hypothetical protein
VLLSAGLLHVIHSRARWELRERTASNEASPLATITPHHPSGKNTGY